MSPTEAKRCKSGQKLMHSKCNTINFRMPSQKSILVYVLWLGIMLTSFHQGWGYTCGTVL